MVQLDLPAPRARIKLQDLSLDAIVLGLLLERVELDARSYRGRRRLQVFPGNFLCFRTFRKGYVPVLVHGLFRFLWGKGGPGPDNPSPTTPGPDREARAYVLETT